MLILLKELKALTRELVTESHSWTLDRDKPISTLAIQRQMYLANSLQEIERLLDQLAVGCVAGGARMALIGPDLWLDIQRKSWDLFEQDPQLCGVHIYLLRESKLTQEPRNFGLLSKVSPILDFRL